MVSRASYPPLQKSQGRGTRSFEMGKRKPSLKAWATRQELSSGTPTANLLTGGVDEVFSRTGVTTENFLADALGSTLATTDGTGALATQYTYEPFGNTSSTGATTSNALQFTGRENDNTGLYFYRARYYSPFLQRFISEDPIKFRGGQLNLSTYVRNDPLNYVDPLGTSLSPIHFWETYNAARAVGYPVEDAASLAWDVQAADFRSGGQDPTAAAANGHGMGGRLPGRKDPQDPCKAFKGTTDYVANAFDSGDTAGALHAIEDSYVHQYAPWNGGSYGIHWPGWSHFYHDLWYNDQAEAAAQAYLSNLNPSNFGGFLFQPRNCR